MGSKHCNINIEMHESQGRICWKITSFGHIPWEYLSQPMSFSAKPSI